MELNGEGATLAFHSKAKPSRTKFKHYQVTLKPGPGWRVVSTGKRPTPAQFRTALSNVTTIGIRGDRLTGGDTFSLDNVVLKGKAN